MILPYPLLFRRIPVSQISVQPPFSFGKWRKIHIRAILHQLLADHKQP